MAKGRVYLVGAGPGDPGLATLRAVECIEAAEVLVYDRLVHGSLVARARADAELIYVGKASSQHTMRQEEINRVLVEKALQGKVVTRLKGGDPFVFGRGGEEAEELRKAGIPFEIVPGVTSAVAVPAYAGIPVTHRGVASSFAVITGHEDPTKPESAINWDKLATAVDTLVFLMGVDNLVPLTEQLMRHGRPPSTPAALIRWGTLPRQRTLTATLGDIAATARERDFGPPAILVVGDVVGLRDTLRWFDDRPLFGQRVLVTRSRDQASVLSRLLSEQGAEPIETPTIRIEPPADWAPLDEALASLSSYHWLVFTSANGVTSFFNRLAEKGRDSRELKGLKLAAIGPATAEALAGKGLRPDFVPEEFVAEAVVAGLKGIGMVGARVLVARAETAREVLVEELARLGAEVHEVAVYRTVLPTGEDESVKEMLSRGEVDVVTFTSSSTVKNLVALIGDTRLLDKVVVACIGPITAQTAEELGIRVDVVAREYTVPGLVKALVERGQNPAQSGQPERKAKP